MFKALREHKH